MKPYTVHVDIDLPREEVLQRFDNVENMYHWQNGLVSFQHLSGEPGQVGSRLLLVYINGKHRIELTETITHRNLPDEFDGKYEWGGGSNTLKNRFIELGPHRTRWESTCHYEMKSLMMKVMAWLMPGKFKEQNQKFLDNFKAFCEHGISVRETV
ncbi:MAG: SRPBCC family protein [Planctomycetota bacterium]